MNKLTYLLLLSAIALISQVIYAQYPNISNIQVTSTTYAKGLMTVEGTLIMGFTDSNGFYQNVENQFFYFNQYWTQQIGKNFYGFTLVSIQWTLLEHTETYDKLAFKIVLK